MMFRLIGVILSILICFSPIVNVDAYELDLSQELIVIEEVYAFQSPVEVLDKIDVLLEKQYPMIIGIMPVYEHVNYPAMIEFTEVIRYAQSRGCRILLHFPIIQKSDVTIDDVTQIIENQILMYEEFEIYPRGILMGKDDVEYEWMVKDLEEILPVFSLEEARLEYYDNTLNESFPIIATDKLKEISYSYIPQEIPEDFDFKRGVIEDVSVSLEKQNKFLIIMVLIWVIIFIAMIIFARRRNRKDFLRKGDDTK